MRIKLDENFPTSLAAGLARLGHYADTVFDENLAGATDEGSGRQPKKKSVFLSLRISTSLTSGVFSQATITLSSWFASANQGS